MDFQIQQQLSIILKTNEISEQLWKIAKIILAQLVHLCLKIQLL